MIAGYRSSQLSYGTDAVAQDLRSVLAVPAARRIDHPASTVADAAPLDLPALYPNLFVVARPAAPLARSARAAAFRLSVVGTAAMALVALFRH